MNCSGTPAGKLPDHKLPLSLIDTPHTHWPCCPPAGAEPFSTQPWNIKGDTLIFDVGSLSFQGNHPMSPPYTEQGCADACLRTPGCNGWTFCSSKTGCGSGCKAYSDKNPACESRLIK